MGNSFGKWMRKKTKGNIIVVGLRAVGKTALICKTPYGPSKTDYDDVIGFQVEGTNLDFLEVTAWAAWEELGNRMPIRPLHRLNYKETNAIIFVFDSNDRDIGTIEQARDEMHRLCHEEELTGVPVLVFANKMDLPNAMSVSEIYDALDLKSIKHAHHVQGCVATTGEGVGGGFAWLFGEMGTPKSRWPSWINGLDTNMDLGRENEPAPK